MDVHRHASITGPVHFIHLGGQITWQHWRAMHSALIHGAPIWVWAGGTPRPVPMPYFEIRELDVSGWLRSHPIQLANVKDYFAYGILREHGGMYLDLDTISLRPAWELLPEDKDLLVSTEYPPEDDHPRRNNSAVMIGRKDADVLVSLEATALRMLEAREDKWGAIGPHLVSWYALDEIYGRDIEQAPYRALNGWSYHTIDDYYRDPRDPGEPVKVIHLYSSDHLEAFHEDTWLPPSWNPTT